LPRRSNRPRKRGHRIPPEAEKLGDEVRSVGQEGARRASGSLSGQKGLLRSLSRSSRAETPVFALDEARYGRERILNLHTSHPTAAEAVRRVDAWLRERQAAKVGEVLVITGRGRGSLDGVPVVRGAIVRLLPALRRAGVISEAREHGEGAFVVRLAPLQALVDAPRRRRPTAAKPVADPQAFAGLDEESRALLRRLALTALASLGVRSPSETFIGEEMLRQFTILAPTVDHTETALRAVLLRALEEYEG
jgi:DNA-nicking Smr family endonuclease